MKQCRLCDRKFDETQYDVEGFCCLQHAFKGTKKKTYLNKIKKLTPEQAYYELKRSTLFVPEETLIELMNRIEQDEEVLEKMLDDKMLFMEIIDNGIFKPLICNIRIDILQRLLYSLHEFRPTSTSDFENAAFGYRSFYAIFTGKYRTGDVERDTIIDNFITYITLADQ